MRNDANMQKYFQYGKLNANKIFWNEIENFTL